MTDSTDVRQSRRLMALLVALVAVSGPVVVGVGSGGGAPHADGTAAAEAGAPVEQAAAPSMAPPDAAPAGSAAGFAGDPGEVPPERTAGVNRTNVTLITGQTVTVVERDGDTRYRVAADDPMHVVHTAEGTYVYPEGVDFRTFDPALFNVDLLIEDGRTDADTRSIPVIIERADPRGTPSADAGVGALDTAVEPGDGRSGAVDRETRHSSKLFAKHFFRPRIWKRKGPTRPNNGVI